MSRFAALAAGVLAAAALTGGAGPTVETISIRGKAQALRVYGRRGADPVVISSGDGGWVHLAPHVADVLAARGWFVVGFDAKAYLASFTEKGRTLTTTDVPSDYAVLVEYAGRGAAARPFLVGVSEGAGLSVLAASSETTRPLVRGVLGLGLPDVNELGWRWRDALIYITKGVPHEPTFSVGGLIDRVSPSPLALIYSTGDEFVTAATARRLFDQAREPKRFWLVEASSHAFGNALPEFDRRLVEALDWMRGLDASRRR